MRLQNNFWQKYVFTACFLILLTACSGGKDKPSTSPEIASTGVNELYEKATQAMDAAEYEDATRFYEEVERQHPYSEWSSRSQIMGAYASYLDQRYTDAIVSLDRYIQLHPSAHDVDYAHYLKALCYYEQITDVRRDQDMTVQAYRSLDSLVRRFPDSKYSRDAKLKLDLTRDHLAGKEMEVGRYYLNRGHVNSAINRFRSVVAHYQTTTHVAEALHRLVESYITLGLKREALQVAAVLGHNYPGSKWYERSYNLLDDEQRKKIIDDRGIIERTMDSLLKPD